MAERNDRAGFNQGDDRRGSQSDDRSSGGAPRKSNRGFASMSPERQREIASKGGRAAHEKGTAHEWTPDEARQAGRKGGETVSKDRAHMAAIGREGGGARSARNRQNGDSAAEGNGESNAGSNAGSAALRGDRFAPGMGRATGGRADSRDSLGDAADESSTPGGYGGASSYTGSSDGRGAGLGDEVSR